MESLARHVFAAMELGRKAELLNLLTSLCICDGAGIDANQDIVADFIIGRHDSHAIRKLLYLDLLRSPDDGSAVLDSEGSTTVLRP